MIPEMTAECDRLSERKRSDKLTAWAMPRLFCSQCEKIQSAKHGTPGYEAMNGEYNTK